MPTNMTMMPALRLRELLRLAVVQTFINISAEIFLVFKPMDFSTILLILKVIYLQ